MSTTQTHSHLQGRHTDVQVHKHTTSQWGESVVFLLWGWDAWEGPSRNNRLIESYLKRWGDMVLRYPVKAIIQFLALQADLMAVPGDWRGYILFHFSLPWQPTASSSWLFLFFLSSSESHAWCVVCLHLWLPHKSVCCLEYSFALMHACEFSMVLHSLQSVFKVLISIMAHSNK